MKKIRNIIAMGLLSGFLSSVGLASDYNRVPAGTIKGVRFEYLSTSAIKIGVGYGEVMGSYWEVGPTAAIVTTGFTLSGLTASSIGVIQYIYIDRLNSSFPSVTVRNSTTAPQWSDDFMGWYDGSDRCIGVVWIDSNGSIRSFYCPNDNTTLFAIGVALPNATISTTSQVWNLLDISGYAPVNAQEVRFHLAMNGSWSHVNAGLMPEFGTTIYEAGVQTANVWGYMEYSRSMAKKIKYMAYATSTSGTAVPSVRGYRIER